MIMKAILLLLKKVKRFFIKTIARKAVLLIKNVKDISIRDIFHKAICLIGKGFSLFGKIVKTTVREGPALFVKTIREIPYKATRLVKNNKGISLLTALFIIQIIAVMFLLIDWSREFPNTGNPYFFRTDITMALRSYWWRFDNRLNDTILYFLIYCLVNWLCNLGKLPKSYSMYVSFYVIMEFILLLEYAASYNSTWFTLSRFGRIGLSHFFIIFKALILTHALWEQSK